jgi:hypothetical protein
MVTNYRKLLFVTIKLALVSLLLAGCSATQESFATPTLTQTTTPTSTIIPTTTATPTLTLTPLPPATTTPTITPTALPTLPAETPIARAAYIHFEGWSPDSQFFAFWMSDAADVDAWLPYTMPGGILNFFDATSKTICPVETIHTTQSGEASLIWQADGNVVIKYGETILTGRPCGDFRSLDDFTAPLEVTDDPGLSPDGRYRVSTWLVDDADGMLNYGITFYEGESALYEVDWHIDQRLGDYTSWLGGAWVSPTQFVIYETAEEGPLLLDAEQGVVPVLTALFEIDTIPTLQNDDYTLAVYPLPASRPDSYHLLLYGIGSTGQFPEIMLFHAETNLVEMLPTKFLWWQPVVDGWLILNDPDFRTGHQRDNLLRRRLTDIGGDWEPFAADVDYTLWDKDNSQFIWIQGEKAVIWQTWPSRELLGRYITDPFWISPVAFSPDGSKLILVGNLPGQRNYGLFLLSR